MLAAAPEILKSSRRQFGITDGVADVPVAQVRLKRTGILLDKRGALTRCRSLKPLTALP
jgi:hypothetical protein